jgi:hypothetical protein
MNDFRSLLVMLAIMALLSLMDAIGRRARQRRAEELDRPGPGETSRAAEREEVEEPWSPPFPVPIEVDEDWREEQRTVEDRAVEDRSVENRSGENRSVEDRSVENRSGEERAAPLVAAAEEFRLAGRRQLRDGAPAIETPAAAPPRARPVPRPASLGLASRLRIELRGDRQALRRAVLYREILGAPLASRARPGGWEEPGPPA